MYHLQNKKIVKILWHNENHWCILKKEGDTEQTPEAPHIENLTFQSQIHLLLQIVRELGRKPTIGYISYSTMWRFMKIFGYTLRFPGPWYSTKYFFPISLVSLCSRLTLNCLNRQKLDHESSANFASNIRQIWN